MGVSRPFLLIESADHDYNIMTQERVNIMCIILASYSGLLMYFSEATMYEGLIIKPLIVH